MRRFLPLLLVGSLCLSGCLSRNGGDEEVEAAEANDQSFLPSGMSSGMASRVGFQTTLYRSASTRGVTLVRWEENPRIALNRAKELDRPMLLLFTANSWSEPARQMADEVLASRTFNALAREHLTLAFLDYPQNINRAPKSMEIVKERFGVRGYPTIILLNPDGSELHRQSGYIKGRPVDFFDELKVPVLLARGLPTDWEPTVSTPTPVAPDAEPAELPLLLPAFPEDA